MGTVAEYLAQAQRLLPAGSVWPRHPEAVLTQMLTGVAQFLARVDADATAFVDEMDPRTTTAWITDWERITALPDLCSGEAGTLSERRDQVVARLIASGGQSIPYFVSVAAALGYAITVEEHVTLTCVDPCDGCLNPWPWPRTWTVHAPAETIREMPCDGASDEPLRIWGNHPLECTLSRWKPAHTNVLFAYGE
ncbi:conserved hypothetical protein [uncultured Alphaproteobacteria bacterium]|uniref:Tail protein n=1 Tax=uncultured Alphaproteobacteria bacterium TaxID=91750 RepID=A0A212KK39_9PROT|nr:conserved hypothetical protein [uncultured Alphaproteobacteria bacterium]